MRISQTKVPNAPCGVERKEKEELKKLVQQVPNAPCGVESILGQLLSHSDNQAFLMHRVELKAFFTYD